MEEQLKWDLSATVRCAELEKRLGSIHSLAMSYKDSTHDWAKATLVEIEILSREGAV